MSNMPYSDIDQFVHVPLLGQDARNTAREITTISSSSSSSRQGESEGEGEGGVVVVSRDDDNHTKTDRKFHEANPRHRVQQERRHRSRLGADVLGQEDVVGFKGRKGWKASMCSRRDWGRKTTSLACREGGEKTGMTWSRVFGTINLLMG